MAKVYANGRHTVTVADGQKIAVLSDAPVKLYKKAGYPNFPDSWTPLYATAAAENYTSAAVSGDTDIRIEAGASSVQYDTGAAPVVGALTADLSGTDATWTLTGLAAAQGGYVKCVGGTSSTAGNAGGVAGLLGGTPGTTGIGGAATVTGGAGGATSGAGGAATLTGGAGTAGNANGGSVVLTPGAKNGSGADGQIFVRGVLVRKQGSPTAKTVSATLTAAELATKIITVNQAGGATSALQLPLGSALDTAFPDMAADDSFDFHVINTSTVDAEDASVTVNTGVTIVGNPDIPAYSAAGSLNSSACFRIRKTGVATWVCYRVS